MKGCWRGQMANVKGSRGVGVMAAMKGCMERRGLATLKGSISSCPV